MKKLLVSLAVVAALSGCATNEQSGQLTGAVVGGLAGSVLGGGAGRVVTTAIGAGIGAVIGGNVGRHMDAQDAERARMSLESSPDGQATAWNNPNGDHYVVTPRRTYRHDGRYCREYETQAMIGGKPETVYGKACRQPDGSWKAM